jgi:Na+-transporting NADH:ubiquinone oxidoreductase subunit NqrF
LADDDWPGHTGFIHDVLMEKYLINHANPRVAGYYLCGPPMMIKVCTKMLVELSVPSAQIAYDEF